MKANELMIGDWVEMDSGPVQIEDISIAGYCSYRFGKANIGANVKNLMPIPLTPEILEKNGFKIDKNETYCNRYFFACNLGKVPQTVVEFSFYSEGVSADTLFKCWTKPESCDGENSIHICDLKSVHELQHALRLCGIEKEIML